MPTPPLPTPLTSGQRRWPRLKFIWGSAERIQGHWQVGLFCSYAHRPGYPGTGLAISVRGLLRWTLVLGVAGYIAGAATIAWWFARNPYNQIRFTDVLTWPVRRGHVAALRGQAWLAQGKDALKANRRAEGAFLLRKGLDLCPEDFEARLVLAQFHLLAGQRPRALTLLTDGALHGLPPPGWRDHFFALAAAGEDWQSTLLFCDRCLPQLPGTAAPAERQNLLAHKLAALIALDRAGEALAFAEAEGDSAVAAVKVQRARALIALGRAGDAVEFLARWRTLVRPDQQPDIIRFQVGALRDAHRLDEMDRALAELRALHPARPEPLAFAVDQRARAGRGAAATLDEFLFRFGNAPANLQLVAQPLAEIPDVPLLQRVVDAATEHGFPPRPFRVQLATALLRAGEWPALARLVADLAPAFAKAEPEGRLWFDWIQCVSDALSSPAPAAADRLAAFMQTRAISLEAHRLTSVALRRAGRDATAHAALESSVKLYAECPWFRAQLAEVNRVLVAAPVPASGPAAPTAAAVPANWRDYFRELDEAIDKRDWAAAARLVANVRLARQPPPWMPARDADLQSRELRVTQGRRDTPGFRLVARLYLNGVLEHEDDVVAFAKKLHAAGEFDDALLLIKAVLEKSPFHPMATGLLAEWQPRKKK